MQLNHTIAKFISILVSVAIGTLLCEVGSRLILNPADYLSAKTIEDKVLGITIAPNSSGFDEWGFRNRSVPTSADIVAIGDSHTFGNTATMNDSWPSVVARVTGHEIYNLGLGGYGPNQYYHLLTTKAFKLHPKLVICGLYMGDDFENAFSITYGLDSWSSLRNGSWDHVDADIWGPTESLVWGAGVRNWLSENSMVYRIVFHGPFLAMVKENIRFREASSQNDQNVTTLIIEDKNIREAFRPVGIANRLDQTSAKIKEGMRITFHLIKEMDKACKQEGCRLLVVIIPTKETVFSEYLESNPRIHLHEALDRLIANERSAKHTLIEFLTGAGIAYMDTLPKLKQSLGDQLYAQTTRDMHPGKNGYRAIGEAVAEYLNDLR
ncbi:MAG: hypothetical protein HOP32_05360 [Nitrospira sp.]|nr:hypothetical protein [Nitrospira sp.]